MHNFYTNFLSVRTLPVPVVAAVNGAAIGAGACVTLAADYRVAKPSAVIGFNFAKLGIHPGMGGSHFLPKLIGAGPAAKVREYEKARLREKLPPFLTSRFARRRRCCSAGAE